MMRLKAWKNVCLRTVLVRLACGEFGLRRARGTAIGTGTSIGGTIGFVGIGGLAVRYYAFDGEAFGVNVFCGKTSVEQLPGWLKQFKH